MSESILILDGKNLAIIGSPPPEDILKLVKHRIGPGAVVVSRETLEAFFQPPKAK